MLFSEKDKYKNANENFLHRKPDRQKTQRTSQAIRITTASCGKSSCGVTSQQIHKYENGLDRIPASRLLGLGQCLSVPITFFYDGLEKYEELCNDKKYIKI